MECLTKIAERIVPHVLTQVTQAYSEEQWEILPDLFPICQPKEATFIELVRNS